MKRIAVLVLAALALGGCVGLTTTETQAMSKLYSIDAKAYESITGDFTVTSFLLYKKIGWGSNETFTIDRWDTKEGSWYMASARFIGPDWRFMERIHLETDDGLFSYEDKNPKRDVLSRNASVEEVVRVELDGGALASLRSTSALRIQFYAGPVTIPADGVAALRDFLGQ